MADEKPKWAKNSVAAGALPRPVMAPPPQKPVASVMGDAIEAPADLRLAVLQFFICYAPDRLTEVPTLLRMYSDRPIELMLQLRREFNQVPVEQEALLCVKNDLRTRLFLFYARYNPERFEAIDGILDKYVGMEGELWAALEAKYGPELPLHSLYERWNEVNPTVPPNQSSSASLDTSTSSPTAERRQRRDSVHPSRDELAVPTHAPRFADRSNLAPSSAGGTKKIPPSLEAEPSRAEFDYSPLSFGSESHTPPRSGPGLAGRRVSSGEEVVSSISSSPPQQAGRKAAVVGFAASSSSALADSSLSRNESSALLKKFGVQTANSFPMASSLPQPSLPLAGVDRSSSWREVVAPEDFQRL